MIDSEFIVAVAGAAIALLFGYFPVLNTRFAALSGEAKSGVMIGLMIVTGFAVWGAGCAGWVETGISCTASEIPQLLKLIFFAIVSNQTAHRIAPELNAVKLAKAESKAAAETPEPGQA